MPTPFKHKPPAFQLYVKDWLTSESVMDMSLEEEAAYFNLLMRAWLSDDCGLPDDDKSLSKSSKLGRKWRRSRVKLLSNFSLVDGRWYNLKLLEQRGKNDKYIDGKVLAGKESGRVRNTRSTGVQQVSNSALALASSSATAKDQEHCVYPPSFEKLWKFWREQTQRGEGKSAACKAWLKLEPGEVGLLKAAILSQVEHKKRLKRRGEFVESWPHLSTWLNQKRFNDEIPEHSSNGSSKIQHSNAAFQARNPSADTK